MLAIYGSSLLRLMKNMFPDYNWLPWRFSSVPNKFWNDIDNQKNYMEWVDQQLDFKNTEDWYKINTNVLFKKTINLN